MKTNKITIIVTLFWYKNDWGGDRRPVTIDYNNSADLARQKADMFEKFRTIPLDINHLYPERVGQVPYKVVIS